MTKTNQKNTLKYLRKSLLLCGITSAILSTKTDTIVAEKSVYPIETDKDFKPSDGYAGFSKELSHIIQEFEMNLKDTTAYAGFSQEIYKTMTEIENENTMPSAGISNELYNIMKYGTSDGTIYVETEKNNLEMVELADEGQVYDEFLRTYATYFRFNPEKVIELARKLTDNYTIPFEEINQLTTYDLSSPEAASLVFVNQLNRNKFAKFGYSKEDFISDNTVVTLNDNFILSDGLTYNRFLEKIADLLTIDKNYALAISLHESGWLTSDNAQLKNNFAGLLKADGEAMQFPTPEAGIIAFCCVLDRYENLNLQDLNELSGMYYYGDRTQIREHWKEEVSWFYKEISNNPNKYFLEDTSNDYKVKFR